MHWVAHSSGGGWGTFGFLEFLTNFIKDFDMQSQNYDSEFLNWLPIIALITGNGIGGARFCQISKNTRDYLHLLYVAGMPAFVIILRVLML